MYQPLLESKRQCSVRKVTALNNHEKAPTHQKIWCQFTFPLAIEIGELQSACSFSPFFKSASEDLPKVVIKILDLHKAS